MEALPILVPDMANMASNSSLPEMIRGVTVRNTFLEFEDFQAMNTELPDNGFVRQASEPANAKPFVRHDGKQMNQMDNSFVRQDSEMTTCGPQSMDGSNDTDDNYMASSCGYNPGFMYNNPYDSEVKPAGNSTKNSRPSGKGKTFSQTSMRRCTSGTTSEEAPPAEEEQAFSLAHDVYRQLLMDEDDMYICGSGGNEAHQSLTQSSLPQLQPQVQQPELTQAHLSNLSIQTSMAAQISMAQVQQQQQQQQQLQQVQQKPPQPQQQQQQYQMRFCPNCGAEVEPTHRFCPYCCYQLHSLQNQQGFFCPQQVPQGGSGNSNFVAQSTAPRQPAVAQPGKTRPVETTKNAGKNGGSGTSDMLSSLRRFRYIEAEMGDIQRAHHLCLALTSR